VIEDLIFNDSTKKFVLLHPEDGGTKLPRNHYTCMSTDNINSYFIKPQPSNSPQWEFLRRRR